MIGTVLVFNMTAYDIFNIRMLLNDQTLKKHRGVSVDNWPQFMLLPPPPWNEGNEAFDQHHEVEITAQCLW